MVNVRVVIRHVLIAVVVAFVLLGLSRTARAAAAGDIVFVFDDSSSIGSSDFTIEKDLARSIVNSVTMGSSTYRVGLAAFDTTGRTISQLSSSQASVLNSINGILQVGGEPSAMAAGLDRAATQLATAGRPGIAPVVIVMSDGNNVSDDPVARAEQLRQGGVSVFVIAIGASPNFTVLGQVAGQPGFLIPSPSTPGLVQTVLAPTVSPVAAVPAMRAPFAGALALLLAGVGLRARPREHNRSSDRRRWM